MPPAARISTQLRRAPTRYEPLAPIATGGMAEVWKARAHFEDGGTHLVAIKRVLPSMDQPLFQAMFEDEARLGMLLNHPNIVRVYDARNISGTFLMIMELVDGDSLKGLLEQAHARQACMPVGAALYIARELACALDYAHNAHDPEGRPLGIVHRDVSPHNVLLGRDGAVKLTDFGLADAAVHETARSEDLVGGKLGYLAPEIVRQQRHDHRIDIFAVGIVLWEMLAGRRLFHRSTDLETVRAVAACEIPPIRSLNRGVPEPVEGLLRSVLEPDPGRRIGSAKHLAERLDLLLRQIDREVSHRDVALLVGLHLAQKRPPSRGLDGAFVDLLAEELDRFVVQASEGASPLDPTDFTSLGVTHRRRTKA